MFRLERFSPKDDWSQTRIVVDDLPELSEGAVHQALTELCELPEKMFELACEGGETHMVYVDFEFAPSLTIRERLLWEMSHDWNPTKSLEFATRYLEAFFSCARQRGEMLRWHQPEFPFGSFAIKTIARQVTDGSVSHPVHRAVVGELFCGFMTHLDLEFEPPWLDRVVEGVLDAIDRRGDDSNYLQILRMRLLDGHEREKRPPFLLEHILYAGRDGRLRRLIDLMIEHGDAESDHLVREILPSIYGTDDGAIRTVLDYVKRKCGAIPKTLTRPRAVAEVSMRQREADLWLELRFRAMDGADTGFHTYKSGTGWVRNDG